MATATLAVPINRQAGDNAMQPRSEVVRVETLVTFVRLLGTYRRLHANAVRWGQPDLAAGVAEQIALLEARIARLRHGAKRG